MVCKDGLQVHSKTDKGWNADFGVVMEGALAHRARAGQLFGPFPIPTPMGEAANSDFVPFVGDPRECNGYVAFPPSFGPPRRQR